MFVIVVVVFVYTVTVREIKQIGIDGNVLPIID